MAKHLWGVSKPAASSGRSLITWAEINASHQGTFAMTDAWAYSDGIQAQLANGNIIVTGYTEVDNACIATLPAILDGREVTQVGSFFDPSNGIKPTGWIGGDEPAYQVGGFLELGSRLYYTKHQWYNAGGTDWEGLGYNTNYAGGAANALGMWGVTGTAAHSMRVAGQMGYAPAAVLADGYTFLAGQQATAGAAMGRYGPNMFAVKVNDATAVHGNWLTKPLIYHPEDHAVTDWWLGDRAAGMWIETANREGVLFLIAQQYGGDVWYGEYNDVTPHDPYSEYKGYHSNGWRLQAWLYDPADLMAVYNGTKDGWTCVPYEKTTLITRAPGTVTETNYSNLRGQAYQWDNLSLRDGRLIIMYTDAYGASPGGHVFNLNAIT